MTESVNVSWFCFLLSCFCSYVAVTGCPEAQEDHAPRMVKFARAILLKMRVLKFRLAEKLGDGTKELELRIGLHSGSITAGYVLNH